MRSCNGMRSVMVMALLSACGSDKEPMRPVDAKYRAAVEGDGVPAGSVVSVDVFWLGDGYVDIRFADADGVVPGPDELKGVLLKDGNEVLNEGDVKSESGEESFVRIDGVIAPEALDLELAVTPSGGETVTVRLSGDARPLGDAAELDGEYLVRMDVYPSLCPGEDPMPVGVHNAPLDVLPAADGAHVTLDGRYALFLPAGADVGAAVEMTDTWYGSTYAVDASGRLAADDVELTLDIVNAADPSCVDRAVLTGGKRVPDASDIDGAWRADYVWQDDCFDESGRFAAPLEIRAQDGQYDFFDMDAWLRFDLVAGEPFGGQFFDYGGTWAIITYEGVVDPPNLAYTVSYAFNGPDGPCEVGFDVTAYKRYFFPEEE